MKGMVTSTVPGVLQPLLLQMWPFEYCKKLFRDLRKSFWTPGASVSLPVKEIRAFVRARGVVWGRRLFCYHVDRGTSWFVMTTQRRPSRAFPALRWHQLGPRSKNMCLCFCSVNRADMTHQEHAGQMFAVTRCHFYTVTFLNAATFSGYFACLRSGCAETGGKLGDWSGLEQSFEKHCVNWEPALKCKHGFRDLGEHMLCWHSVGSRWQILGYFENDISGPVWSIYIGRGFTDRGSYAHTSQYRRCIGEV